MSKITPVPVAVHPDVDETMVPSVEMAMRALSLALSGGAPLAVLPCDYRGQAATMLALLGREPGQVAPLAVFIEPGEVTERGAVPTRQAHDGVPLSTGQYL